MNLQSTYASLFFILLISSMGCKAGKKAGKTTLKPKSSNYLLKRIVKNDYEPEWVVAKGKLSFKDEYQSFRGSFNLRIRKDSVIWLNIKKLSIEGARIQINQDSVFAIDRMNKQYVAYPLDQLEQRMGIPLSMDERPKGYETNFRAIQSLLLGYPPILGDKNNIQAGVIEDNYVLSSDVALGGQAVMIDYEIRSQNFLLHLFRLLQPDTQQILEIEQSDYHIHGDSWNFPYFRHFRIKTPDYGNISIKTELSKVEIDVPTSIRFSIPSHYERVSD